MRLVYIVNSAKWVKFEKDAEQIGYLTNYRLND